MNITASILYDYTQCPHRVWRDVNGPQEEKSKETNPFVELLWDKGVKHEEKIVSTLGGFTDLKSGSLDARFDQTIAAMKSKTPLIYQGVLKCGDMLGIPDLLEKLPDDTYMPIDIKAGMGFEDGDDESGDVGKYKEHYAVQLCLYNDLLKKIGFAAHNMGKIIDIHGEEVEYDLVAKKSERTTVTWWDVYEKIKKQAELLINNQMQNKPAMSSKCKLCPWYDSCAKWCKKTKDPTTVFYLGRNIRDRLSQDLNVQQVDQLIDIDVEKVMAEKERKKKSGDKEFLYRISDASLQKSINRAKILYQTKKPVIYGTIDFPKVQQELFFDIEDDPTQEFVYLHGVYERNGKESRFLDFTATEVSDEAEKDAWKKFWEYIKSLPKDNFAVYYYSHHEKTSYKKLQKRYPDIISSEDLLAFFDDPKVIDLYRIIQKQTDWPVNSYSLKALASYLGFEWRDETPSGALSIQWFNEYLETKDKDSLDRILKYNEDDCKATMVLKDGLVKLNKKGGQNEG